MKEFPKSKKRTSYEDWAEEIFVNYPTQEPILKEQVYLWVHKWETGQVGIWKDFGSTPLPMQESMLIGLCYRINDDLLNTEGLSRTYTQ